MEYKLRDVTPDVPYTIHLVCTCTMTDSYPDLHFDIKYGIYFQMKTSTTYTIFSIDQF